MNKCYVKTVLLDGSSCGSGDHMHTHPVRPDAIGVYTRPRRRAHRVITTRPGGRCSSDGLHNNVFGCRLFVIFVFIVCCRLSLRHYDFSALIVKFYGQCCPVMHLSCRFTVHRWSPLFFILLDELVNISL